MTTTAWAAMGTESQIEWAEQIRPLVIAEFDRVASLLATAALRQSDATLAETELLLVILAEKRAEVLANESAGYFIREWRDTSGGQVRRMIAADARFQNILANRAERRKSTS